MCKSIDVSTGSFSLGVKDRVPNAETVKYNLRYWKNRTRGKVQTNT